MLDREDNLVLPGSGGEGELCVRGCTLALGYYNDPVRTGERFVQNPLNSSYPEIIKRLGYRIELGEIEAAAGSIPQVRDCACVYDPSRQMILFLYTGQETEKKELSRRLSRKLPKYMMPNRYIYLEEMPRNPNGKIDRKRLKEGYV